MGDRNGPGAARLAGAAAKAADGTRNVTWKPVTRAAGPQARAGGWQLAAGRAGDGGGGPACAAAAVGGAGRWKAAEAEGGGARGGRKPV
jgi:hypothetical protein